MKVDEDGPEDAINVGQSLVPRHRRIVQAEASDSPTYFPSYFPTSTEVALFLDKSDESRDGTISKKVRFHLY